MRNKDFFLYDHGFITTSLAFFDGKFEVVTENYEARCNETAARLDQTVETKKLNESLEDSLERLLPIRRSPVYTKTLIIDTTSNWCLLINNGYYGADRGQAYYLSKRWNMGSVRVELATDGYGGRPGSTQFAYNFWNKSPIQKFTRFGSALRFCV